MGANLFAAVAIIILVGFAAAQGAVYIATAGFLRLALASLSLAVVLSLALSALANTLLSSYLEPIKLDGTAAGMATMVGFLKALVAAFAQPTLTGIVMLAILLLLSMGAAQIVGLTEEIQILLDTHKAVAAREEGKKEN